MKGCPVGRPFSIADGMDIYRITISRRDFAAAYALPWRHILTKPWVVLSWVVVMIGAVVVMGDNLGDVLTTPRRLVAVVGIPVIGWLLMYLLLPRLSAWIAGRWQYDNYPMVHRDVDLTVEQLGLNFLSAGDHWRNTWSDYLTVAEDRQIMLHYVSSRMFQILPVHAVPADVRAGIAARIAEANRSRRRSPTPDVGSRGGPSRQVLLLSMRTSVQQGSARK